MCRLPAYYLLLALLVSVGWGRRGVPALDAGLREIYRDDVDLIADGLAADGGVDPEVDLCGRLGEQNEHRRVESYSGLE